MDITEAEQLVISVVCMIQSDSGRPIKDLNGSMAPIEDLVDFDSMNGIEATTELESRLGCDIKDDNLLASKDGDRALSVNEIAKRVCEIANQKEVSA